MIALLLIITKRMLSITAIIIWGLFDTGLSLIFRPSMNVIGCLPMPMSLFMSLPMFLWSLLPVFVRVSFVRGSSISGSLT